MGRLPLLVAVAVVVASLVPCAGGEVAFSGRPTAEKAGDQVKICFAVSEATDVEVAVLGAGGKVVRHLAAGVLGGKNPPPAPLQAGLAQELTWDGRDDAGAKAEGGPFTVQVRAGMSVKFGRMIGGSPYTGELSGPDNVAVADDGTLYVNVGSMIRKGGSWSLIRLDNTGTYQKTLLPYSPSTEAAKANGFRLIDAGDGLLTPACRSGLDPVFLEFSGSLYHRLVDGSVVFISTGAARMTFFKVDGSNAVRTVPMRSNKDKLKWAKWLAPQVAFSPDGRFAYYSNVANTPYDGKKPSDIDPNFPQGRIYRHDLTRPGADAEKFFDLELPDWEKTKYWMPSAWDKKTAAAGIDMDDQGNLFVCDLVNQEVVKVSPEGKELSAVKAPWPDKVRLASKSEAIYVLSAPVSRRSVGYGRPAPELLKLDGRGPEAKVVARLKLEGAQGESLALDESGKLPALWVGGRGELLRVEDRGTELAVVGTSILNRDKDAVSAVIYGDVDAEAELVYVTNGSVWRYDGRTGEGGRAPFRAIDLAVGPGGMIYTWGKGGYSGPVLRFHRDFSPAPLGEDGKNALERDLLGRMGRGLSVAGLDVDARGRLYACHGNNSSCVQVFDADGKLVPFKREAVNFGRGKAEEKTPALITGLVDQSGSLRVDPQGNVYVIQLGLPDGHVPPKGFEKEPSYLRATGTIYKLGPEGGQFDGKFKPVAGVLRAYGTPCGTVSGEWASTGSVCHCTKPRFDVDGFGRLYIPNSYTYKVTVIDNADNPILAFGGYGNFDAQGPDSAEPSPAIPLGWPITAGASERSIYVGDCLNHRVVRVDKAFAVESRVEVK